MQRSLEKLFRFTSISILSLVCSCQSTKASEDDSEGEPETSPTTENNPTGSDTTDSSSDSEYGSDSATGDDANYYQIKIKPEYDIYDPQHGDQGTLYTYSFTTCEYDEFSVMNNAYPYIWLMIFFHEDYDLVGTHLPRVELEGGYQQGFLARYNDEAYDDEAGPWDQYIVAQSGTIEVLEEGEEDYLVRYDLVFSDDIHEVGEMLVSPCESPIYDV